jgi:hypothetical protein
MPSACVLAALSRSGHPADAVTHGIQPQTRRGIHNDLAPADVPAFFEPVLILPRSADRQLSLADLVEAHAVRALRTEHGVSIQAARDAAGFE